jgi:transposase InsO family protein
MQLQGNLSVERMCHLGRVNRAGFYRHLKGTAPRLEKTEVRSLVQQIAVEHRRRLGSPRMTWELRNRGMVVNHKRVERIMREDNLLAIRYRKFVTTSESKHDQPVYLNLASRVQVTGPNQLWVADITYIRLQNEFVYLAVLLDAFSRRVVGWALERSLQARLTLTALERAIAKRNPPPGLIHHSDRGIQYACSEYVKALAGYGILSSMSRAGCPYDNALIESWFKTLKQEEIYAHEFSDMEDLIEHLKEFIDRYYNRLRLHSALGYRSPERFEAQLAGQSAHLGLDARAAALSFSRQGRSFNPMWEKPKQHHNQGSRNGARPPLLSSSR